MKKYIVLGILVYLMTGCSQSEDDELFESGTNEVIQEGNKKSVKSEMSEEIASIEISEACFKDAAIQLENLQNIQQIDELQARLILNSSIEQARILIEKYNIPLSDYFQDVNDPRIALVGFAILAADRVLSEGMTFDTPWDCALRSMGLKTLVDYFKGKITRLSRKVVQKIIFKIAGRTLGWIGTAIAAYQFGKCMGWYKLEENNNYGMYIRVKIKSSIIDSYIAPQGMDSLEAAMQGLFFEEQLKEIYIKGEDKQLLGNDDFDLLKGDFKMLELYEGITHDYRRMSIGYAYAKDLELYLENN